MHWSLVVVHVLILTVISFDSFPIDLMEIEEGDIYSVDKQRKGRFIAVNQTTFLPNMKEIELIREKKSSQPKERASDEKGVNTTDVKDNEVRGKSKTEDVSQVIPNEPLVWDTLMTRNESICADNRYDLQTIAYSLCIEDHSRELGRQQSEFLNLDCCPFDPIGERIPSDFYCIDDFIVPEGNSYC